MEQLKGQVAVVTGASRGIGRAIALRLCREGARVMISSRTAAELEAVAGEAAALSTSGEIAWCVADATARNSARMPVTSAIERFGKVDILVNNVGGIAGTHDSLNGGDESFEATLILNLTSAWWTSMAALPGMLERRHGRIINIGSTESLHANAGCPPGYVVAKHGLAGLTRQLAQDVGASGVTVNCICPGWTRTALADFAVIGHAMGVTPAEAEAYAASQCAQNLVLEPAEIAATAAFLASAEAARITGQILSVDGGYRL
jgi:NAD(P)-dependent dehydrogenase (short-subunit alcohol dehydrogenase family)